jgi:hypothetical protein
MAANGFDATSSCFIAQPNSVAADVEGMGVAGGVRRDAGSFPRFFAAPAFASRATVRLGMASSARAPPPG